MSRMNENGYERPKLLLQSVENYCFTLSIMQIRDVEIVVICLSSLVPDFCCKQSHVRKRKKAIAIIFNVFPPNSELVKNLINPKQLYQANQLNTTFCDDPDEFIYFLLQLKNGSQVGAIVQVIRKDYIVVTLPLLKYRLCYAPAKLVGTHGWRQTSLSSFCFCLKITQVT